MLQCSSRNQDIVSANWLPLRFESSTNWSRLFRLYDAERRIVTEDRKLAIAAVGFKGGKVSYPLVGQDDI
jgi:hypothetical protein